MHAQDAAKADATVSHTQGAVQGATTLVQDIATAASTPPLPSPTRPPVPRPSPLSIGMPCRTLPLLGRTSLPLPPVLLPASRPPPPSGAPMMGTPLLPRAVLTWSHERKLMRLSLSSTNRRAGVGPVQHALGRELGRLLSSCRHRQGWRAVRMLLPLPKLVQPPCEIPVLCRRPLMLHRIPQPHACAGGHHRSPIHLRRSF